MEGLDRLAKDHPFLRDLSDERIHFIAGCATNVRVEEGGFLFREGHDAEALYLLRYGKVALEIHVPGKGTVPVETLGEGDVFGWSWLFPPFQWQVDARAVEMTRLLAFDAKCLRAKMAEDREFGYEITKRLLAAIYERLERVRLQRLDIYASEPEGAR